MIFSTLVEQLTVYIWMFLGQRFTNKNLQFEVLQYKGLRANWINGANDFKSCIMLPIMQLQITFNAIILLLPSLLTMSVLLDGNYAILRGLSYLKRLE